MARYRHAVMVPLRYVPAQKTGTTVSFMLSMCRAISPGHPGGKPASRNRCCTRAATVEDAASGMFQGSGGVSKHWWGSWECCLEGPAVRWTRDVVCSPRCPALPQPPRWRRQPFQHLSIPRCNYRVNDPVPGAILMLFIVSSIYMLRLMCALQES